MLGIVQNLVEGCHSRTDLVARLPHGGIGAELGVAEGCFSKRILDVSPLSFLYSIDKWNDAAHNDAEYRLAVQRLDYYRTRNAIWRMSFAEARPLIMDETLDFLYIDGYAHTGEENGQTIEEWWSAVKPGGIIAGDDYDLHMWPQVVTAVNRVVLQKGAELVVIPQSVEPDDSIYGRFPTWVTIRE